MLSAAPTSARTSRPSDETVALARREVRRLLSDSPAFRALDADTQTEIAQNTVKVAAYLAEPDGIRATAGADPYAFEQAQGGVGRVDDQSDRPEFEAHAAREGAEVAGLLLERVNFPDFVAGLIDGVFHSIVQSSIDQMEAYGRLVADVAKSLNQFRDENVSVNQGRDQLVDTFPDIFEIDTGGGGGFFDDGGGVFGDEQQGPRVRMRAGVDENAARERINASSLGTRVDDLSDETIENRLVPAARTQLATSRQQLLATMVMMGINRIIVTDGKIQAKVLYDFRAQESMRYQRSATSFDYGDRYVTTREGEHESEGDRGSESTSGRRNTDDFQHERDHGSYYAKGTYKHVAKPVMTLMSATQEVGDAALQTRASLAGVVDVNFRSETFPLERLADSFQIAQIQNASQPNGARSQPVAAAPGTATQPASGATPPATGTSPPAAGASG